MVRVCRAVKVRTAVSVCMVVRVHVQMWAVVEGGADNCTEY